MALFVRLIGIKPYQFRALALNLDYLTPQTQVCTHSHILTRAKTLPQGCLTSPTLLMCYFSVPPENLHFLKTLPHII